MLPRDRFQDVQVIGVGLPNEDFPEKDLTQRDTAQLISTLKAFGLKVGLLLNFSEGKIRDGLRRVVLTKS